MKTTMTALAVLMLASAAPGLAAGQDRGEDWRAEREERRAGRLSPPEAPQARSAPTAPEARPAPEASSEGWRGREGRRGGEERRMGRPGGWVDDDGDETPGADADRFDREDRREAREWRRYQGGGPGGQTGGERRWDGDGRRNGEARGDRDGRWEGGDDDRRWDRGGERRWDREGDRRGDRGDWRGRWNSGDRDRWDRHDRDRDRRRGDRPYWSQGRYPFLYSSPRRYRVSPWRPPAGFYARSWRYGDHLPWGWYGSSYVLSDWWSYGLPWPPPGFDWVRVGSDALLVDRFTGRVVQVVRLLFW